MERTNDLSELLRATAGSDAAAIEKLFGTLYEELRGLAHFRLRRSPSMTLLDTTGLVHESFLRCVNAWRVLEADRGRFLSYAARAMRSVVIDYLRRRSSEQHGGQATHVTLDTALAESVSAPEDQLLRINEALDEIAASEPRLVRVVEMRFFAGLTEAEIATTLGITERTVRRDWDKARVMLSLALK
jgi:RNA polymerase sigma factor (TIGR02999 family)